MMEAAAAKLGTSRFRDPRLTSVKRRVHPLPRTVASSATRDEWFVRGTEPATTLVAVREAQGVGARITAPTDGTIVALIRISRLAAR